LLVFDLLAVDGEPTIGKPFHERRRLLEEPTWTRMIGGSRICSRTEKQLFASVCKHGREGVVAKRLDSRYRPGERGWVKTKNRAYWRYPLEVPAVQRSRERSTRVTSG
jgi:bifunctional non-homologous end joining protein LigD